MNIIWEEEGNGGDFGKSLYVFVRVAFCHDPYSLYLPLFLCLSLSLSVSVCLSLSLSSPPPSFVASAFACLFLRHCFRCPCMFFSLAVYLFIYLPLIAPPPPPSFFFFDILLFPVFISKIRHPIPYPLPSFHRSASAIWQCALLAVAKSLSHTNLLTLCPAPRHSVDYGTFLSLQP